MNPSNLNRFDQALGPQTRTLSLRNQRAEILANNIANTETPGFLARDLDFKAMLADEIGSGSASGLLPLSTSHAGHVTTFGGVGSENSAAMIDGAMVYRVPTQPSSDGNTAESAVEKAEFAKNSVQYVADLSFLNARVQGLLKAIRGE